MKNFKTIILVLFVSLVVVIALTAMKKPATYAPTQTNTANAQENLSSDLKSLDSVDLDTGTNAQLDQLSSDSSSF